MIKSVDLGSALVCLALLPSFACKARCSIQDNSVIQLVDTTSPNNTDPASTKKEVLDFVNKFCEWEFTGHEDLWDYVLFTTAYRIPNACPVNDDECLDMPHVIAFEGDPLVVVRSYSIQAVRLIGDKEAEVDVIYRKVAHSVGEGMRERYFVEDSDENETVRLLVRRWRGKWVIVDPPLPRIGIGAMIEFYQRKVSMVKDTLAKLANNDALAENKALTKLSTNKNYSIGLNRALADWNRNLEILLRKLSVTPTPK